jgi:Protein of unknown function (DUF3606)
VHLSKAERGEAAAAWPEPSRRSQVLPLELGTRKVDDMADDKTKVGAADRSRVASEQDYEVDHFAKRHGITADQARELIRKHGNNRDELDAAAGNLRKR